MALLLRVIGWNAVFIIAGVGGILLAKELYHWQTMPFTDPFVSTRFRPGVGLVIEPNTEIRWTNRLDYWTVSRTNSMGFLDREPISPEQAARSCHISLIGDSFVAALEVPIADKSHVRLEELVARELPHLNVTTSAFGIGATGQVAQLRLYDAYARWLSPKLVVLPIFYNDLADNSNLLTAAAMGWRPDRGPYSYAERTPDGTITLIPPYHEPEKMPLRKSQPSADTLTGKISSLFRSSHILVHDLQLLPPDNNPWAMGVFARLEALKNLYPQYRDAFGDWQPADDHIGSVELADEFFMDDPPSAFKDAVDFTAFALDQFKQRAARDNFALLLLQVQLDRQMRTLVTSLATDREIPIVNLNDYLASRGIVWQESRWAHDTHWNPAGHQWAAEALLEYLKHNQAICTG